MSLIQEALRRREEEEGRRPETPGDRIVTAPEAAVPAAGRSRKEWLALLAVLVLVLAVSVCAVGLLVFIARTLPRLASQHQVPAASAPALGAAGQPSATAESQARARPESPSLEESVTATPAPPAVGVSAAQEVSVAVATADAGGGSSQEAGEGPPIAESPAVQTAVAAPGPVAPEVPGLASRTAVDRVAEARRVVSRDERRPEIEEETWPVLQVSGIIRQAGGVAAAIVNGKLVSAGDRVDGVDIVAVEMAGVWVELKGQRKFIRVGGAFAP